MRTSIRRSSDWGEGVVIEYTEGPEARKLRVLIGIKREMPPALKCAVLDFARSEENAIWFSYEYHKTP
jgi:hypothetical protein